jgi:hypothetical protein
MARTELAKKAEPPSRLALVIPKDLVHLDAPALREELTRALAVTADNLRRLAAIVYLLEERGEDLGEIRIGLLDYLRRIAHGQVLPETVVRFGEWPRLMRIAAALPLPDQQRLATGAPVVLVVRREAGAFDRREVDPLQLTGRQLTQVFGPDGLRDEPAQCLLLEDRGLPAKKTATRTPTRFGHCTADVKKGGIRVGKHFVSVADTLSALSALAPSGPVDEDTPSDATVAVKLTEIQQASLKICAARGGTNVQSLVRRALNAAGLFGQE